MALVISAGVWLAFSIDKKYPGVAVFPKYKDVYVDDMSVSSNEISQGDALTTSISVYNNTEKDEELAVGVYIIKSDKVYDGSNVDYASQKQQYVVGSKSSKKSEWKIPVVLDPGQYKILFWLHQFDEGAERVVEDSWYPKIVNVISGQKPDSIRGEESNADQGLLMSGLLIKPVKLEKSGRLAVSYRVMNNFDQNVSIETGVYLIDKDKQYKGDNVDQVLPKKATSIAARKYKIFTYDADISLPAGEYKVLIWLHKMTGDKSEVVFDYWAPGNIIVEGK